MQKYDLAVAYRIYPGVSKIPPVFADNKVKLAELCLHSFKKSLGDLRVKMFVLLDNCPPEYDDIFLRNFDKQDVEFIRLSKAGNEATFEMQIDLLLKQNDSEYVYFAEDDYYYLPGAFVEMLHFLKGNDDVDFTSAYDHLNYYTSDFHNYKKEEKVFKNRCWRTSAYTCLTFLTTKKALKETRAIFETFSQRNYDSGIWCALTKKGIFNPLDAVKYAFTDMFYLKTMVKSWLFGAKAIVTGKKYKLWTPVPTIATHMENQFLSPNVNWDEVFNEAKAELNF